MTKVKAIQSFVNYSNPDARLPIDKNYAYITKLSSLLLQEHYGEVTLYTNEKHLEGFQKMNLPYKYDTELLSEERAKIFSEVKLRTFLAQDKPFIHFDLDSIVGKKIDLYSKTTPFLFSHPDKNKTGFRKEGIVKKGPKSKVLNKLLQDEWFHDIFNTYLKYLWLLKLPEDWPNHLIIPEFIPNMNIVGVKDNETFNKAVQKGIWIAENNRQHLTDWESACFIEQLVIPLYLAYLSPEYQKAQQAHKEGIGIDSFLLTPNEAIEVPQIRLKGDTPQSVYSEQLLKYPFEIINNYSCSECLDFHKRELTIESDESLANVLDLTKYSFAHIGGFNKNVPMYQAMTIYTLNKYFGEEAVLDITKVYTSNTKSPKLSPGELAYEQLTGHKLFTNFFNSTRKKSII